MYYATSQASFPQGKKIPEQTTHFFMSNYYLVKDSDQKQLTDMVSTAPEYLEYFKLTVPSVKKPLDPVDIIANALAELKPSVRTLDVDAPLELLIKLDDSGSIIKSSFDDLPKHITTLHLSYSYNHSNINMLTQLFSRLPKSVKKIILSFGYLPQTEEIETSLKQMADTCNNDYSFGLEWHYREHTIENLVSQIKSIGEEKVTTLILNDSTYGANKLLPDIELIPGSITSIVLPSKLFQLPDDELKAFFDALPSSVTEVDCIQIYPPKGTTAETLQAKFDAVLPSALPSDRVLNFINLRVEGEHIIHYRHEAAPLDEPKEELPEDVKAPVENRMIENVVDDAHNEKQVSSEPETPPQATRSVSPTSENNQNQFFAPPPPEEQKVSHDDTPRHSASLQFMLNIINAPPAQLAVFALGVTLILACSGAGLLALGAALTVFGGIGLAKSTYDAFSTSSDTESTGQKPA